MRGNARAARAGRAAPDWSAPARRNPDRPDRPGSEEPDPEDVARQICLRLLTAAPRTRAQLAAALRRRNVPGPAAEAVLGRFTEAGLIDDAMFASAWVESRHHGRGLARRALAAELRQRGVAAEQINAAVETLGADEELAMARALVARKLATSSGPPQAQLRRLAGLLARKGYSPGLAYRVIREALDERGTDPLGAGLDEPDPADAEIETEP